MGKPKYKRGRFKDTGKATRFDFKPIRMAIFKAQTEEAIELNEKIQTIYKLKEAHKWGPKFNEILKDENHSLYPSLKLIRDGGYHADAVKDIVRFILDNWHNDPKYKPPVEQ